MIALFLTALVVFLCLFAIVLALFAASVLHDLRPAQESTKEKRQRQIPLDSVSFSGATRDDALKAVIRCARVPPTVSTRFRTAGYTDCRTMHVVYGGNLACPEGCLGLGTCSDSCPCDAIVLRDGMAYVNDACNGCGACVDACPKKLISLVPVTEKGTLSCAAKGFTCVKRECPVALDDFRVDLQAFPESGFKLLGKWGILRAKSR
jgi:ferredoxin